MSNYGGITNVTNDSKGNLTDDDKYTVKFPTTNGGGGG